MAHFYKGRKNHLITVVTEHKCVLDSCRHLELEGFEITYLPVKQNGLIDLEQLKAAIRPDTTAGSGRATRRGWRGGSRVPARARRKVGQVVSPGSAHNPAVRK